jgi:hypothetical protein
MKELTRAFIFGFVLTLILLPPLRAQSGTTPDDATKKITELVHTGKYAEAQKLTIGLLVAYPNDQRLLKAKALIDRLLSPAGPANATPGNGQETANANAMQLTGMDKVEYNTLIELAREAQQNPSLAQQRAALQQFMDESTVFLRKHPDQTLLWQLRAASAISLNDPMAGYEAGQTLLAAGAADSNDPNLQRLLAQLNTKGWLDKQKAEDYKQYGGILGTWNVSWSLGEKPDENGSAEKEVFVKSETGNIEGYYLPTNSGHTNKKPSFKGTILDSGRISWEEYMPTSTNDPEGARHNFVVNEVAGKQRYPSGWQPPISCVLSDDKSTMTMVFQQQTPNPKRDSSYISQHPVTLTFEKISDSQSQ